MTKKENDIKQEIGNFLQAKGWTKDAGSNYKNELNGSVYRMKFNTNVLRYEVKSEAGWVRLRSGYWKDISITEKGIRGLT